MTKPALPPGDRWVTVDEAALFAGALGLVGLSVHGVRRLAKAERVARLREGHWVVYWLPDLQHAVEQVAARRARPVARDAAGRYRRR